MSESEKKKDSMIEILASIFALCIFICYISFWGFIIIAFIHFVLKHW